MKILIVPNIYYPINPKNLQGGIESFSYNLYKALSKRPLLEAWLSGPADSIQFTNNFLCWSNLSKEGFVRQNFGKRFNHNIGLNEFIQKVRALKPDLIISNSESNSFVTSLSKLNIPIVQFVHCELLYRNSADKMRCLKSLKEETSLIKVVAVSKYIQCKINRVVDVVDDVLPLTYIEPKTTPFEHPSNYLLYVGRISKTKGVDILVDAFSGTSTSKLIIAGDAPNNPHWEVEWFENEFKPKLESSGNIQFLPNMPQSELFKLTAEAKALLIPVKDEAFSLVGFEAHKLGVPVIVNRGKIDSGVQSYIENGLDGFYVNTHQERRETVLQLFRDAASKVHTLDRETIYRRSKRFSEDMFVRDLLRICDFSPHQITSKTTYQYVQGSLFNYSTTDINQNV